MTPNRFHRRRRPRTSHRDALHSIFEELRRERAAGAPEKPDLAGRVLSRLGYRATDRRSARLARWSSAARRLAATATLLVVTGSSLWWIDSATRHASLAGAIPEIVSTSLRENRERLNDVADSLAPLSNFTRSAPLAPSTPAPSPAIEPNEARALAPFRKA